MSRTTRSRSKLLKASSSLLGQAPPTLLPFPAPKISSYKYLRRTLYLDSDNCKNLKKFTVKRFHLKKIIEYLKEEEKQSSDYESAQKGCCKKSLFKCLTSIEICSIRHKCWLHDWKNSKRLTKFNSHPSEGCQTETILCYFGRINKNIEKIDFAPFYADIRSLEFQKLYKNVRKFRKLKAFRSKHVTDKDKDFIKQEFLGQYRSLQRSPFLQELACYLPEEGQISLRNLMEEGQAYPKITKLYVNFENFSKFQANIPNAAKIAPFFNFQVFPNLKTLTLKADVDTEEFLGSLDCYVISAFKELHSLEKLYLRLTRYLRGVRFIFKGLLELPQLSTFSLEICGFHDAADWETLIAFAKIQINLVCFKLDLTAFNEFPPAGFIKGKNGEKILEDFFASLSQKPRLQYLALHADCWPLKPLSQGLKRLVETPKLKSVDLRTSNECSVRYLVLPSSIDPFEGLCGFLVRNSETLQEPPPDIPILQKQKYNGDLNEAISQLSKLRSLSLQILTAPLKKIKNCRKKDLDPKLDMLLPRLEKLQELELDFEDVRDWSEKHRKWMGKAFKILPSLKGLRGFKFLVPVHRLCEAETETINLALKDMEQVVNLNLLESEKKFNVSPHFKNVSRNVKALAAKRHLCVNLSF